MNLQSDFEQAKEWFLSGIAALESGNYTSAELAFKSSLELVPNRVSTINNLTVAYLNQDKLDDAQACIHQSLALEPGNLQAKANQLTLHHLRSEWNQAIHFYTSELNHEEKSIEIMLRLHALSLWEIEERYQAFQIWFDLSPEALVAHETKSVQNINSEIADSIQSGRWDFVNEQLKAAFLNQNYSLTTIHWFGVYSFHIRAYSQAKSAFTFLTVQDPQNPEYWSMLGEVYMTTENWSSAADCFDVASKINVDKFEYKYLLANAHFNDKNYQRALEQYDLISAISPDHVDALYGSAVCLEKMHQLSDANGRYQRVLDINPRHLQSLNNKGNVCQRIGLYQEAIELHSAAHALAPANTEILCNLAISYNLNKQNKKALETLNQVSNAQKEDSLYWVTKALICFRTENYREAIVCYRNAFRLKSNKVGIHGLYITSKLFASDWDGLEELMDEAKTKIKTGEQSVTPFSCLNIADDIKLQTQCVELSNQIIERFSSPFAIKEYDPSLRKLKIAFVSPDFNSHPVSYLTAEFIESIDRNQFEVIGLFTGKDDGTEYSRRMRSAFDVFHDISPLTEAQACQFARGLMPDVAIDLAGYTDGAMAGLFINRIAPIQINMLGFPGSLGADFCDYLIADDYVVPENSISKYAEKIIYMPICFQPNDSKRNRPLGRLRRSDLDLPEDKIILAAFNSTRKILPYQFDLWVNILQQTTNSILWMTGVDDNVHSILSSRLSNQGVDPSRLLISPRTGVDDYLARLSLADLFLDTYPFNAGTTCSDAMWMGLPVLTRSGESFASRMAGSILRALQLNELITHTDQAYVATAVRLVSNPAHLIKMKSQLLASQPKSDFFNGRTYAFHFERALRLAHQRHKNKQMLSLIDLRSLT